MSKLLPFLLLFLIITATPVLAGKVQNKDQDQRKLEQQVEIEQELEECDEEDEWKNHGEYVSCVAKQKLGGKVVSEAARSDIGKKEKDEDDEDITPTPTESGPTTTPTLTPSVSPTVTPSVTPTGTLTPTPTPNVTGTPTPTPEGTESADLTSQAVNSEIKGLIEFLNQIISSLKNLL